MRFRLRSILFGLGVGLVLAVSGAFLSAGGHNFSLMMVFFPWAMLLGSSFGSFAWWLPFVVLVLLQFPIYFSLTHAFGKERAAFWAAMAVLILVHTLGVVWCFVAAPAESWRILFRW